MNTLSIKTCPTCGSKKLAKVSEDWESKTPGIKYTVPSLEYFKCSDCGEELYDHNAMKKIEKYSPKIKKKSSKSKVAA